MEKAPTSPNEPTALTAANIHIVGVGNIGSFLTSLIARESAVASLSLIDGDRYDLSNLVGQDITAAAIGRPKVEALAEKIAAIRPGGDLRVVVHDRWLDLVPLGAFSGSHLIVGCLDSKAARQTLSEIAFRLGIPYLDCGVNPAHSAARLSFFDPRRQSACVECAWGANDYAHLEARKSCLAGGSATGANGAPPTGGSAWLGSFTASIAAAAIVRFLHSGGERCLQGTGDTPASQVVVDAHSLSVLAGGLKRSDHCRFDHAEISPQRLSGISTDISLDEFFSIANSAISSPANGSETGISVPGLLWITDHRCANCTDSSIRRPALRGRSLPDPPTCPNCGHPAHPFAYTAEESKQRSTFLHHELESSLASFGIEPGDILEVTDANTTHHLEIPFAASAPDNTTSAAA